MWGPVIFFILILNRNNTVTNNTAQNNNKQKTNKSQFLPLELKNDHCSVNIHNLVKNMVKKKVLLMNNTTTGIVNKVIKVLLIYD